MHEGLAPGQEDAGAQRWLQQPHGELRCPTADVLCSETTPAAQRTLLATCRSSRSCGHGARYQRSEQPDQPQPGTPGSIRNRNSSRGLRSCRCRSGQSCRRHLAYCGPRQSRPAIRRHAAQREPSLRSVDDSCKPGCLANPAHLAGFPQRQAVESFQTADLPGKCMPTIWCFAWCKNILTQQCISQQRLKVKKEMLDVSLHAE